ncbi:hypothetical protein J3B02_003808 [Coemansia erecta]|nr:hypothetical protein J3B02_003808 [Coemansia erecta]KAJ2883165.1 hypothetical protein FB639_002231 [Coemansia asiatica]
MTTPSDCATASKVYSANTGDFLCNYAASLSIYNRDCKVPYGTVYAVVQPDDFGVAALYSHSAIYGDSMCSSQKKLHYYTVLRNYIPWASRQIGRSVGGFSRDSSFELATNYDYSMTAVSSAAVSGVKVFSGDRYSQDPANPSLADPSPPPETSASASAKNSQSSNETNPPATSSAANSKESPKPSNSNEGEGAQASAHVGNSSQQSNNGASTGASNNSNSGKSDSNSSASATDSQSGNTDIEPSESETAGLSATDKANNSGENNASNKEGDKGGASKTIIIVAIVVVLLLAAGGGIWYLWKRKRNRNRSIAEKNGWETRNSVRSAASSMQLGSQYLGHSGRDSPGLARRGSNTRSDIIRAYSGDNDRDSGRYSGGFRDSSYPAFNTQGTTNMHIGSMGGYSGQTRNGGYHNGGPSNYYQQGNGRSQYKTDSMDSNNF